MDMNAFIRGSRRGVRPPEPSPDPERDARLVAVLEELGEPVPAYLRPSTTVDWGGGPRGSIPIRQDLDPNEWLREAIARKMGLHDA